MTLAAAFCGQANAQAPIFRVEVTSKTVRAVNYNHRQGTVHIDFKGTALLPEARGEASVMPNTGASRISLHFDHLSNPAQFGPEFLTYVLWAVTPEGRAERLGEIELKSPGQKSAALYATTDLQSFAMIVTAEPYFSVKQPSDAVVMENFMRTDTTGTIENVEAKYELLKRGDYTLNISADRLTPITSDLRVPLEFREAREAIAIAKAQGADHYAADTMKKAADDMTNADGYFRNKQWKQLDTVAREATQMAEDARRISIVKEGEEATQATADASAAREADAQAIALNEARRAQIATEAAQKADADRMRAEAEKADAEKAKREAELAMNAANASKLESDAARRAALDEQARLEAERTAAVAGRQQAEKDTQALRDKLKDQLNAVLATRDTARGLIVNMSDVLFDFNQSTLKSEAREKLAKISGIFVAYPSLHFSVEGHTDSVGTDDYNQKLSERRADSVRDYLTSNGIGQTSVDALGLGKADPVASNDTAAGRQQNRRVELVVSGDAIGHSTTPADR